MNKFIGVIKSVETSRILTLKDDSIIVSTLFVTGPPDIDEFLREIDKYWSEKIAVIVDDCVYMSEYALEQNDINLTKYFPEKKILQIPEMLKYLLA